MYTYINNRLLVGLTKNSQIEKQNLTINTQTTTLGAQVLLRIANTTTATTASCDGYRATEARVAALAGGAGQIVPVGWSRAFLRRQRFR